MLTASASGQLCLLRAGSPDAGSGWSSRLLLRHATMPRQDKQKPLPARATYPPPEPGGLAPALMHNIRTLQERRSAAERAASMQERVAEAITRFTGSMTFVCLHVMLFRLLDPRELWSVADPAEVGRVFRDSGHLGVCRGDFLSTFVLISQNRMAAAADKRADLDLHISLLAEHEYEACRDGVGDHGAPRHRDRS